MLARRLSRRQGRTASTARAVSHWYAARRAAPDAALFATSAGTSRGRRAAARRRSAAGADAGDHQFVVDVPVAVLRRRVVDPLGDERVGDLDGVSATAADQMVVMAGGGAAAVEPLASLVTQHVEPAALGQAVQGAVHGAQ